jgi:hypothetical protein
MGWNPELKVSFSTSFVSFRNMLSRTESLASMFKTKIPMFYNGDNSIGSVGRRDKTEGVDGARLPPAWQR